MSRLSTSDVSVHDLELDADGLDPRRAAGIYEEHGALIVRGLMKPYISQLNSDIAACAAEANQLLPQAKKTLEGFVTPDGTLWIPAPKNYSRDKQIMVLACGYKNSAAAFASAIDKKCVDIVEAVLGP